MVDPSSPVRPEVLELSPCKDGLTAAEVTARSAPARISRLGSNEGPMGPSPRALAAAGAAVGGARLHPDPASLRLRGAIGVPSGRVMVGNASEELAVAAHCNPGTSPLASLLAVANRA